MKNVINIGNYYNLENLEKDRWKVKYEIFYLKGRKKFKSFLDYIIL